MKQYLINIWIAVDQLGNALTGGDPQETISSRCGRRVLSGNCLVCGLLCRVLDIFWPDHCIHNITKDNHGSSSTKD